MFAVESQRLSNKRHFFISVIAINVFYCSFPVLYFYKPTISALTTVKKINSQFKMLYNKCENFCVKLTIITGKETPIHIFYHNYNENLLYTIDLVMSTGEFQYLKHG